MFVAIDKETGLQVYESDSDTIEDLYDLMFWLGWNRYEYLVEER